MNLVVICSGCGTVYRCMQSAADYAGDVTSLVGERSEFWPDKYTCARCGSQAAGSDEHDLPRAIQVSSIVDLTPEEMFSALHGLGLPEDNKTTLVGLTAALGQRSIKRVVGKDVPNTGRCTVEYIELDNGTKIYFGASTHGAVVYRVVQPVSYAQRVISEEAERGSHL